MENQTLEMFPTIWHLIQIGRQDIAGRIVSTFNTVEIEALQIYLKEKKRYENEG